ncbi:MAG TPA: hypothetical protein PKD72_07440 [Gemmatales bacterium]|nr:hypothetical protein [Gemmatales bacterium]
MKKNVVRIVLWGLFALLCIGGYLVVAKNDKEAQERTKSFVKDLERQKAGKP